MGFTNIPSFYTESDLANNTPLEKSIYLLIPDRYYMWYEYISIVVQIYKKSVLGLVSF